MMRCLGSKADGQRDGVQGAVAYGSVLPDQELFLRLEATVCPVHRPQSAVVASGARALGPAGGARTRTLRPPLCASAPSDED